MRKFAASITIAASICSASVAVQHTPSYTIDGNRVSFDATLVNITPIPEYVYSGTKLTDSGLLFGTRGTPVVIVIKPDVTYDIRMQGHAETPEDPNRLEITDTILVVMTENQKIRAAAKGLADAIAVFLSLQVDFDKVSEALNTQDGP